MRQFNTTAVNLRAALDDVDPLITASRPVARKLKPFARKLRGFARDAVPTIKGLDGIVTRKGAANDLIELTELQVPLAEIGVGPVIRNGESREGALPASATALGPTAPAAPALDTDGGLDPARASSAPTSPRTRSPAGSTTSATPASRTRSAASAASTPPSTPSPRRRSPAGCPVSAASTPLNLLAPAPLEGAARHRATSAAAPAPTSTAPGSHADARPRQLNYTRRPDYQPRRVLDCDPARCLPGP